MYLTSEDEKSTSFLPVSSRTSAGAELTSQAGSNVNIGGQEVPGAEGEDPVPQGALGGQAVVKGGISYNNITNVIMSFQGSICPNNDIITPFGQGILNSQALSFVPRSMIIPILWMPQKQSALSQWGKA